MRTTAFTLLIVAILLQGCAGTVSPNGKSSQTLLEGSKELSQSSEDCPRGLGIIRLYKDTMDGNKTKFNAKLALTSAPIKDKINVYSLLKETADGEKAKAEIDSGSNSIIVTLSENPVGDATAKATGEFRLNEPISIRYNPKAGYYENWGSVAEAALSDADAEGGRAIIQSLTVQIGKLKKQFAVPESIDSATLDPALNQKFSATIGEPFVLKINPKSYEAAGTVLVQFFNGQKGSKGKTYNYVVDEGQGLGEIPVPTKGIEKGDYAMNIFRSEVFQWDIGEGQNFCMEVSTGAMGVIGMAEPEVPAAK